MLLVLLICSWLLQEHWTMLYQVLLISWFFTTETNLHVCLGRVNPLWIFFNSEITLSSFTFSSAVIPPLSWSSFKACYSSLHSLFQQQESPSWCFAIGENFCLINGVFLSFGEDLFTFAVAADFLKLFCKPEIAGSSGCVVFCSRVLH